MTNKQLFFGIVGMGLVVFLGVFYGVSSHQEDSVPVQPLGGGADQTFCSHIATSTIVVLGPQESRMVMGTSSRQSSFITATTTPVWIKPNFIPTGNGQGIAVFASTTLEFNDINKWEGAVYGRAYATTSVYVVDCDNARP